MMLRRFHVRGVWVWVGSAAVVILIVIGVAVVWRDQKHADTTQSEDFSQTGVAATTLNALVVHVKGDRITVKQLGAATTEPKTYTVKITPQTVFTSLENPQSAPTIADVKENHAIDIRIAEGNLDTTTITAKEIVIF